MRAILVAAAILGRLLVQGLRPGPQLFRQHPDIVYSFMRQSLVTSLMLAVLGGLAAVRIFGQVLPLPRIVLAPVILLFVTMGIYSINNAVFDLCVLLGVVLGLPLDLLSAAIFDGRVAQNSDGDRLPNERLMIAPIISQFR